MKRSILLALLWTPLLLNAQTACDSVVIDYVRWAAFTDTAVEVHVHNNSSSNFDHPGFILFDQNHDTLAKETVPYIGLAQESWHLLRIKDGVVMPQGTFSGTLELWTNYYTELACTYAINTDLCPPGCVDLYLYLAQDSLAAIPAEQEWTLVYQGTNTTVGQAVFYEDPVTPTDIDTLCIGAGDYNTHLSMGAPLWGISYFGVYTDPTNFGRLSVLADFNIPINIHFHLFAPCIGQILSIAQPAHGLGLEIALIDGALHVSRSDGHALGGLQLIDVAGRVLSNTRSNASTASIPLDGSTDGVYTVIAQSDGSVMVGRVGLVR